MSSIATIKLTTEQADKLAKVVGKIPDILSSLDNSDYDEIFGFRINTDDAEHVDVAVRDEILLKFLIANEYDVDITVEKIVNSLNWRNKFRPLSAAFLEPVDEELKKLGVITNEPNEHDNLKVITWNLYGNVKSPKKLFERYGDGASDEKVAAKTPVLEFDSLPGSPFLRWRIGLMERALQLITFTDPANHKLGQVHDYKNVSMLRMDPGMKAATKEIISIFTDNYPELLSTKFFINVPTLMSWVFGFFAKIGIISQKTLDKFKVLNLGDLSPWVESPKLPAEYCKVSRDSPAISLFDLDVGELKAKGYGDILLKKLEHDDEVE
jgi:hypothetical protein